LPLTERVSFKTRFQCGGRLQVSKYVRWRFKLESDQILAVHINVPSVWDASQSFLCTMTKDGRINIPKVILELISIKTTDFDGRIVEVSIQPF
jgi:hypothetical protein